LPLDCDEFVVVQTSKQSILCDYDSIHQEFLALIEEDRALAVRSAYYNILEQKSYYWCWPHQKTLFRSGTFGQMDHGYHEGKSRIADGRYDTRFVYMHYHHKPHATIVEHSKNKMRPFFDVDVEDRTALQEIYDKNRLARFIVDDEDTYMKKFTTKNGIYLPVFEEYLEQIGCSAPFEKVTSETS
jgi:hypothetical protein